MRALAILVLLCGEAFAATCPSKLVRPAGVKLCAFGAVAECVKACDAGDPLSCHRAGEHHRFDAGDVPRALAAFRKGCDGGYGPACTAAATLLVHEDAETKDVAGAKEAAACGCALGDGAGCVRLGRHLQREGKDADALRQYLQGCAQDDVDACGAVGELGGEESDASEAMKKLKRTFQPRPFVRRFTISCPAGATPRRPYDRTEECVDAAGKRHGPYVDWSTVEDMVAGPGDGVMSEAGRYAHGKRVGLWKKWDPDKGGHVTTDCGKDGASCAR